MLEQKDPYRKYWRVHVAIYFVRLGIGNAIDFIGAVFYLFGKFLHRIAEFVQFGVW